MGLKSEGRIATFRLTVAEHQQLTQVLPEGESVSDLMREALYQTYGIGELAASSMTAARAIKVHLSPQERQQLEQAAMREGVSIGDVIRRSLHRTHRIGQV